MIPLIVDLETEWRGGQSQALLLLKGLYERGHAAELLTARGSPLARRANSAGIYVHEVSCAMLRLGGARARFAGFCATLDSIYSTQTKPMP